jgi:hypothetical protein
MTAANKVIRIVLLVMPGVAVFIVIVWKPHNSYLIVNLIFIDSSDYIAQQSRVNGKYSSLRNEEKSCP